jgi:hypothetical protein
VSIAPQSEPRGLVPRPLLAEAVAYVGAPVASAGAAIVLSRSSLATGGRLVVALLFVGVFLAVGFAVGDDESVARLRSVMWFAAVLAWFALVQVLVFDLGGMTSRTGAIVSSLLAAAGALGVWWLCRRSLQQIALFAAAVAIVAAAAFPTPSLFGFDTTTVGLLLWILGLVWLALGAADVLAPRRTALVLGAVTALLAPIYLLRQGTSLGADAVGFLTALGLLVAGHRLADRAVEGLAIVGLVSVCAAVVVEHLRDPEMLAVSALLVGLALLAAAVAIARRSSAEPVAMRPSHVPPGDPPPPPTPSA